MDATVKLRTLHNCCLTTCGCRIILKMHKIKFIVFDTVSKTKSNAQIFHFFVSKRNINAKVGSTLWGQKCKQSLKLKFCCE